MLRRVLEVDFDVAVDFVELEVVFAELDEVDELGEPPSPAPPLLGDVPALAGAANVNVAASATATSAAGLSGLRSTCVARKEFGYDKHNPFSFWRLRG